MKRFFCLLLMLTVALPSMAGTLGEITWIYDGDTLEVAGVGRVRLLGIDAPEHENSRRDRYYRRWGISPAKLRQIASEGLKFQMEQVKGKQVRIEFDREKIDKYGRHLGYVYLPDGQMLNRLLLKKGYASVFRRFEFRHKEEFLQTEAEARKTRVGLWAGQ